jgi:hypothetical protein
VTILLILLFFILLFTFAYQLYARNLNRGSTGFHRNPSDERSKRKPPAKVDETRKYFIDLKRTELQSGTGKASLRRRIDGESLSE